MKLSQPGKSGTLTRSKKIHRTGSENEGYHKTSIDAHGAGACARAGGGQLFGVGAAGADGGKQWGIWGIVSGGEL